MTQSAKQKLEQMVGQEKAQSYINMIKAMMANGNNVTNEVTEKETITQK